jgi:CRISPR-associated protein Cmx8
MSEQSTDVSQKKKPARKAKRPEVDPGIPLILRWNLHELPSSQHRAGLAGLALSVKFLRRRKDRKGVCSIESLDDDGLTIRVDRQGMQELFDDVYAATIEETASKSKWAGTEPKRVDEVEIKEEKTGKLKTEKRFVYDRVVPSGPLVADWDAAARGAPRLWLKLWQDMVWTTLRGVPATREPFNARAERRTTDDGGEDWDELASRADQSVDLPSTYALGAQAKSAENVAFQDVVRTRFLLHFWSTVVAIYVPAVLQRDGKRDFLGYALAMPDVSALQSFVEEWESAARDRSCEPAGYVPREAVIDLAAEAGLDLLRRVDDVIARRQGVASTRTSLNAVDVFHIEKEGNNVRLRSLARVVPERVQVDEYARVRQAGYRSPVFRRQRISNVLEAKPFWWGFARLCATTPEEMTIAHTPFRHDCRSALTEVEMKADVPEDAQTLEHLIYRRVQAYVLGKTERKYDLSWPSVQGNPGREAEYRDKREKVAREAFLAVRSRTGADFVAYFTATLCSIPHRANEEKYLELARALTRPERVEHVRSLTLLALSAVA